MEIRPFERDPSTGPRGPILTAAGVIILAALAAYHGSFFGPFIFDDVPSIVDNAAIRHLWPPGSLLSLDQGGVTTSGRPMLNISFALNYALGGLRVWSYHAVNLAIHILAGLTLFGIMRRTLERSRFRQKSADGQSLTIDDAASPGTATLLALAIALIWTVHPLLTESVTYIVQRGESLMGLFYLLTLYGFIRYADETGDRLKATSGQPLLRLSPFLWGWLSIGACLLGMATKEVMVSAPVIVLLYDRTFVTGSFRAAWRHRRWYYLSLAATWLFLAYFVSSAHDRGGTTPLDVNANVTAWSSRVTVWSYWRTQFPALVHYLTLAAWPHPLVFDYGLYVAQTPGEVVPYAMIVLGLAIVSVIGLCRGSAWGFLGFSFFAIMAPTSVVPLVLQTMAEHRMYLALAPVVAAAVLLAYRLVAGVLARAGRGELAGRCCFGCCLVAAAGYGFMTARRNEQYRSEVAIWQATVAARPDNARAQYILGAAYRNAGDYGAAIERARESLRIQPDSPEAQSNWGRALADEKHWPEAIAHYEEALRLAPDRVKIRYNLGSALFNAGRLPEAVATYEQVVEQKPDYADAYANLGIALAKENRWPEAIGAYEQRLRLEPHIAQAHFNLGQALFETGQTAEALTQYEEALRLKPHDTQMLHDLGDALADAGQNAEAASCYEEALQLEPNDVKTHGSLGAVFIQLGRVGQAAEQFAAASRLEPDNAEIHNILGCTLAKLGRTGEARTEFEAALRLKPDDAEMRANLARLPAPPQN